MKSTVRVAVIAELEERIGPQCFGRLAIGLDPQTGEKERRWNLFLPERRNDFFVVPRRHALASQLMQHARCHIGVEGQGNDLLARRGMIETQALTGRCRGKGGGA